MAISNSTVWEIRSAGHVDNGGGYTSGGTDHSQQDAAWATYTDIVIDGATDTDITSAATPFASDDVGNLINITGGTGFTTGRYEIMSVAVGVATLDRAVGTVSSTGGAGRLGGAMTLTVANEADILGGNHVYIKADGTHTLTSDITLGAGFNENAMIFEGYSSTRGDDVRAVISHTTSGNMTLGNIVNLYNIEYNHSVNNDDALHVSADSALYNVKVNRTGTGAGNDAIIAGADSNYTFCEVTNPAGIGFDVGGDIDIMNCYIHDCVIGIAGGGQPVAVTNTIFDTCSTEGYDADAPDGGVVNGCTFYNCGVGISYATGNASNTIVNNIFDNCTTGITAIATSPSFFSHNNFSNNGTDWTNITSRNETTLDPEFTDAAGGDFTVGSNMKAIGIGTSNHTSYVDLGAVQTEPAGGAGYTSSIG